MSQARFIEKYFEQWRGLHKGYSDLSRPEIYASACQNTIVDDNFDLAQRPGFKVCSQKHFGNGYNYPGLFPYFYRDSSGNIIEELLTFSLNSVTVAGHKMGAAYASMSILIQYLGAGVGTFSFLPIAGNLWQIVLLENGVAAAGFPATYSSLIDSGTGVTLSGVMAIIDALPNWVVTITDPLGLNAGAPNQLTIDLFPITPSTSINATGTSFQVFALNPYALWATGCMPVPKFTPLDWNSVNWDAVNMNNLMFFAPDGDYIYKYAGGASAQAANTSRSPIHRAGMPPSEGIYSYTPIAGGLTGDYVYHTTNVFYDRQGNRIEGAPSPDYSITLAAQVATLAIHSTQSGGLVATVNGNQVGVTTIAVNGPIPNDLKIKTDPEGVPERRRVAFYNRNAGLQFGLQWGAYPVNAIDRVANTITIQGSVVNVNNGDMIVYSDDRERFLVQGFVVNGNQVGVNTINTVATDNDIVTPFIGDKVYLLNRATGNYEERTVTSFVSSTSITISGAVVNVNNGDFISFDCRLAIYRTVAGGTEKYLVAEIPNNGFSATTVFTDSATDASILLNGKYLEPERIPGAAPKARYVIEHQGLLVCTDGKKIYFSEPDSAENFPDENSFFLPFSLKGDMTGLGVDNGILVVFKEYGRARVYGDLASNAFTSEVLEDGIGCKAGHTIQNTPAGLIWLSHTGFQIMNNGALSPEFNSRLSADFKGQEYPLASGATISAAQQTRMVLKKAVAINDFRNKRYICYIPALSGPSGTTQVNSNSKYYVYDYKNDAFYQWVTPTELNPINGMAIYQNELFFMGGTSFFNNYNYLHKESNRGDIYDAADNTAAIDWIFESGWDTGGEPSAFKKWLRMVIRLADPANALSFTLSIKVFRDFSSVTAYVTSSKLFTAATTLYKKLKLKTSNAKAIKVQFRNSVLHESPRITGYELEVTLPNEKEVK